MQIYLSKRYAVCWATWLNGWLRSCHAHITLQRGLCDVALSIVLVETLVTPLEACTFRGAFSYVRTVRQRCS